MAIQRRARQLTGEDEMDEVGWSDGSSFIHLAAVRGLWKEEEGQVGPMKRVGQTNQVKKLHGVFLLRVLQASVSQRSRENALHQNSPTGHRVIPGFLEGDFYVCVK